MFWRFGYANIASSLDSILDKQDVTVEELLDESDLIQELKQQNSKLVEFLRDEPVLKKLLGYVTADASSSEADEVSAKAAEEKVEEEKSSTTTGLSFFGGKSKDRSRSKSVSQNNDDESELEKKEAQRKKYAYVSCEILSSEVWSITEALLEHPDYMRDFWQYLYRPAPLDALQAGYFTKVNESLLDKKTGDMLHFLRTLDGIVPAMLQHVDCPMIMDLLLKIISLEKHEGGQGIVDWLQSQNLIPLLLGYLSSEHSPATQTSAGDFLKAIITISANATTQDQSVIGPNELTRQLVSEPCIKTLIDDMLGGGNPLTVGVGIIIEVIRKNNSDYDLDNQAGPEPKTSDPIYLGTLLRQFAQHIPDFMHMIRSPSARKSDLKSAFGGKIEPLGFDRFKTCELMAELLHCSNMVLLNERGAEEDVRRRDAERERLKAEGKLRAKRSLPEDDPSHAEFGSSVDSHGFHHAERPSDDEMDPSSDVDERHERKLEVQNASDEDGFEKVTAPAGDDLPDEVTFDDLNEKTDGTAQHHSATRSEKSDLSSAVDMPLPLSPSKKPNLHFDPPPTRAIDSPTTSSVTEKIGSLDVDEDTVMTEFGEEMKEPEDDELSELDRALARPEDKPAPLFAKPEPTSSVPQQELDAPHDIDTSVATLQGQEASGPIGERAPYETELDGRPVVGDLLKIQFVEHQVVPTILDFFFRFPWNNFLHNVVYDVVQQVFNGALDRGYNRTLAFDLFQPVKSGDASALEAMGLKSGKDVTDRILDGQRTSDASQTEKGMRLGYMGHLTLIAEEVCKFGSRPPESLDQLILDRVNRDEWVQYVEGTLTETRDKDNAVLGGVRPENAIASRAMGGLGGAGSQTGFQPSTNETLANAGLTPQDNLGLSDAGIGQSFEINAGLSLSGFGDGDDDDEMDDDAGLRTQGRRAAFSDDEQNPDTTQAEPSTNTANASSIPPPLNIPPSRARRTLAARLAQKQNQAQAAEHDPDAADATAVDVANHLSTEPSEELDAPPPSADTSHDYTSATTSALSTADATADNDNNAGLHFVGGSGGGLRSLRGGAHKLRSLFSSDDDSSDSSSNDSSDFGDGAVDGTSGGGGGGSNDPARGHAGGDGELHGNDGKAPPRFVRRPSTTEAKIRTPLDDGDDDEEEAEAQRRAGAGLGGGSRGGLEDDEDEDEEEEEEDSSDEDDVVEIHPRRTSSFIGKQIESDD